jgi:hypothetical protein
MRDQYVGDISDLLKLAFLRALAAHDRSIGVGWYYNPINDGRADGNHREYCKELKWKALDATLFDSLVALQKVPSVRGLEELAIWPPKALFHHVPVPPAGSREAWTGNMVAALREAGIVFLDPDNGVGNASQRHATVAEIAAIRKPGRTVVLIKFPGRDKTHAEQIEDYHTSLLSGAGARSAITLCTNVFISNSGQTRGTPRARWFTLVDADDLLIERAKQFAARLDEIDKCSAHLVYGARYLTMPPDDPCNSVLRLMGFFEKGLRALTSDQSMPFHKQVEAHRGKFSDIAGITDARRVRNAIAHGDDISATRCKEAQAILRQALAEIVLHCPERLRPAIREAMRSAPGIITPDARPSDTKVPVSTRSRVQSALFRDIPKPNRESVTTATLPICDWVYFATASQGDRANTKAVVSEFGMIIRSVYNNLNPPNAIANVKHIRQGHTILLVYGGKGEPYRPMFVCTVVTPQHPVPNFDAFAFADQSQDARLKNSGFTPGPHLLRFTGISIKISAELSAEQVAASIRKPRGINTIRRWKEVEEWDAQQKHNIDSRT